MAFDNSGPKFYTTREAANILGVTLSTIQNWESSGYLTAWKTAGGHRRILKESVDSILNRQPREEPARGTRRPPGNGLRMLIAGSDAITLRGYASRAASWIGSREIETALDGYETLLKIGRHRPDILLVDLPLPLLDSPQLMRAIDREPSCQGMRLLLLTEQPPTELQARGPLPSGTHVFPKSAPCEDWGKVIRELGAFGEREGARG